jgi:hypothetical protein
MKKMIVTLAVAASACAAQADVVIAHGSAGPKADRTVTVTETVLNSFTVDVQNSTTNFPATATGSFSATGVAGSFTYTMRGYTDWNHTAGAAALGNGTLGAYVGTLTQTNTYVNNSWGVAGGTSNFRVDQLVSGVGEAMILEFDTTGLTSGYQLSVKSLGFLGYAGSARNDIYFYDSANNQISASFIDYDANGNADTWLGNVSLNDGDFMIIKSGISSGDTDGFNLRDLTVDVIPEPATLGMVAVFGGGLLLIRRLMRI